jgi:hypothetical protein
MKEIICYSKKYGNQIALVDDADFETINKHSWSVYPVKCKNNESNKSNDERNNYKFYAITKYKRGDKRYQISMHQMILGKVKKGFVIDHINGNSLNNTRTNLREVTYKINCQNKKPKNKYLGVSWNKRDKKYQCNSMGQYIGTFDDEKTAAKAYDKYIIRNLGSDSRLNFKYTLDEIKAIENEVVIVKKERELPKFINLISKNTYRVRFRSDNYKVCKTFETVEDAIVFKDKCLDEIKKLEDEKLQLHYQKQVTKNEDGIPYIIVKHKNKEYQCLVDFDKWHDLSLIGWCFDGEYVKATKNQKKHSLHKYLYEQYHPDIDITDKLIDHIDGKDKLSKRLDNRMSNLRLVTAAENAYNRETKNKWGYRGIEKSGKKFSAQICHNNQTYRSKVFPTIEEAALAYNELAVKYYGDIAKLNVIKGETSPSKS